MDIRRGTGAWEDKAHRLGAPTVVNCFITLLACQTLLRHDQG